MFFFYSKNDWHAPFIFQVSLYIQNLQCKGDTEIPIYGLESLELKEIVKIYAGRTNKDSVFTKRPYMVLETYINFKVKQKLPTHLTSTVMTRVLSLPEGKRPLL